MYTIDNIPFENYGMYISSHSGQSHLPEPKDQLFTVYGEEGYQITARKENTLELKVEMTDQQVATTLNKVPGLKQLIINSIEDIDKKDIPFYIEFCLHGMASFSMIGKTMIDKGFHFKDLMGSMFSLEDFE